MSAPLKKPSFIRTPGSSEQMPPWTQRAGVGGQRRSVSVLVVDVVGSMSLSAAMSAEAWWTVIEPMFALLSEGVNEFGGWVENFAGDGIAAVFAARGDQSEHARRACAAALSLRDRLKSYGAQLRRERGLTLSARCGINSGDVVVGRVRGADTAGVVTVGHTASLAKRIESQARPGSVYVSESTASLVQNDFKLRELGVCAIRGADTPITLFELVAHSARQTRGLRELTVVQ